MDNIELFNDFCAGFSFWNVSDIEQEVPTISPCFTDTVLVWCTYGYLWLAVIPYLIFLYKREDEPPLPWLPLVITKTILSIVLICLVTVEFVLTLQNGYTCIPDVPAPTALYVAVIVKLTTYLLILLIENHMRRKGVKSSGVNFVFWGLVAVADIVPLYSALSAEVWCPSSVVLYVRFVVLWVQMVLRCFADQYHNRGYQVLEVMGMEQCPEESASVLNKITYSWIASLIVKAYKTTLTTNDLWEQTRRLRSKHVVNKLQRAWKRAQLKMTDARTKEHIINYGRYRRIDANTNGYSSERSPLLNNYDTDEQMYDRLSISNMPIPTTDKGPSLYKVIFKTFGWLWFEASCYKLLGDTFNLLQPVILQQIIDIIERRDVQDSSPTPAWIGYAYTVALFVSSMIKSLLYHCTFNHMIVLGLSLKTALIGAVYKKALSMSNASKKSSTVGEIVNLMSVDCQRIQDSFTFSHYITSLPFMITVSMVQLYLLMGLAMFGGLAVVVIATVTNGYLGRVQQKLQIQILALKGKRIKILNELINGVKVLKMYTWEEPFQQKVTAIRKEEISRLWKYAILTAFAIFISIHSPFMVNYVLILIYTLSNSVHYLDAQTAFVVLSLVNILRGPITITPFVITGFIQGWVSVGRVQSFLWKEDISEDNIQLVDEGRYMISVDNGSFTWDRKAPQPTLKHINIKMKRGKLFAVVGQVGCGKTSLISAVLGEMEKIAGTVTIQGKIAYVPQEAWIQNLTVRENILFGKPMDEERYNKVIKGCALLPDLEILSGGDMTEIGEKGINISGGQKQRVSLARAVYSDADIFLLDDPLSAVDSHVGKHLFKNVIGPQGLLKRQTRILVTHGIHWLPMVDKIFVMVGGRISESGTYEHLISRDGPFAQFIQNYADIDDESDGDDTEVRQMRDKVLSDVENLTSDAAATSGDDNPVPAPRRRRNRKVSGRESFGMSFSKEPPAADLKRKDQALSRLVQEEASQKGAVKFDVFRVYAKAMGYIAVVFVMLFMIAFQSLNVFSNYWLTYWTEDIILKNISIGHTDEYENQFVYYLVGYTIIGVVQSIAILAFGVLALTRMVAASGILHKRMLECILRSPMSFFDTTPVGRIMNRFSSDIDVMDDRLPMTFRLWNIQIFSTLATVVVVSVNTPPFMIVIVPVLIIYLLLLKFFLPTARQVKRLESVLRSPIYNHFSESITGVNVIRAYRCGDRFIEESQRRVDKNVKFFFAANSASRWIGVRLEFLGNILILAASIFALLSTGLNGAQVGLSITYALQITLSLNLVIQAVAEMEMNIVSAERVKEYTELHHEAPWIISGRRPSQEWPRTGSLEFRLYRTRYREGLDLVLKGISFNIKSGEKIGIVGRTGAGKSSLTLSLFRLIEAAGGSIHLDGQNIADMGLHDLRSKLTILPQDPVLFSGSLRTNLDPFGRFDDTAIWKAIQCAHLKTAVENMLGQLDYECGEGGANLSMGQRQLVCLARTLMHKTRVLILDEATAAVDLETDDLIQNTIRTEFSDCTILTIAHRLNTIMDYDRVMVLSDGQITEMDEPGRLLENKDSAFYKMARDAGLVPS